MKAGEILFWLSLAGLLYTYAGYPFAVYILARFRPKPVRKGIFNGRYSVLIACHNEADHIERKLKEILLHSDGDRLLRVLVGDDGSSDGTADIARRVGDGRIEVIAFERRRGKPAVLNDLIAEARGDVVVMMDARQRLERGAISRLLANFADPEVGVVSGELMFETGEGICDQSGSGMGVYWKYEKWIRQNESRSGSVPGATGALYAIRRELLKPIPSDMLLDDVAFPMLATSCGARCILEPEAHVWDRASMETADEFIRKRRTFAGVLQAARQFPQWAVPCRHPLAFRFLSHKVLRVLTPWMMFGCLCGSAWAAGHGEIWGFVWAVQVLFYVCSIGLWLAQFNGCRLKGVWSLPAAILAMNFAMILAWWDACRGRYPVRWRKASNFKK